MQFRSALLCNLQSALTPLWLTPTARVPEGEWRRAHRLATPSRRPSELWEERAPWAEQWRRGPFRRASRTAMPQVPAVVEGRRGRPPVTRERFRARAGGAYRAPARRGPRRWGLRGPEFASTAPRVRSCVKSAASRSCSAGRSTAIPMRLTPQERRRAVLHDYCGRAVLAVVIPRGRSMDKALHRTEPSAR